MSREDNQRLGTADLVAGTERQQARAEARRDPAGQPADVREPRREMPAAERAGMPAEPRAEMRGEPRDPALRPQQQAASQQPPRTEPMHEELAALFPPQLAQDFRNRWDAVQIGFVDDPRQAVQHADELVAQVMKSLAASFAEQRSHLEAGLGQGGQANTESLRVALRSYRSFFQRLLSL
ncbi:MAG: hypothetical protein ACXWC6_03480 [Ramlibacter sp.]